MIIATIRDILTIPSTLEDMKGGHLEMLRNGTEFMADIIEHRVREVTSGDRFSVTLFTPSHLDKLTERDWLNLESRGFPVHLYAERAKVGQPLSPNKAHVILVEEINETSMEDPETNQNEKKDVVCEAHAAEGAARLPDPLAQLAAQIPQPQMVDTVSAEMLLHKLALLTREFNRAMNLPEGASLTCVSENRAQEYGRMLREEVQVVEKAVTSGSYMRFWLNWWMFSTYPQPGTGVWFGAMAGTSVLDEAW